MKHVHDSLNLVQASGKIYFDWFNDVVIVIGEPRIAKLAKAGTATTIPK